MNLERSTIFCVQIMNRQSGPFRTFPHTQTVSRTPNNLLYTRTYYAGRLANSSADRSLRLLYVLIFSPNIFVLDLRHDGCRSLHDFYVLTVWTIIYLDDAIGQFLDFVRISDFSLDLKSDLYVFRIYLPFFISL